MPLSLSILGSSAVMSALRNTQTALGAIYATDYGKSLIETVSGTVTGDLEIRDLSNDRADTRHIDDGYKDLEKAASKYHLTVVVPNTSTNTGTGTGTGTPPVPTPVDAPATIPNFSTTTPPATTPPTGSTTSGSSAPVPAPEASGTAGAAPGSGTASTSAPAGAGTVGGESASQGGTTPSGASSSGSSVFGHASGYATLSHATRSVGWSSASFTPLPSTEDSERQRAVQLQQEMHSASLLNEMTSNASVKSVEAQAYRTAIEGYAAASHAIAA